MNVYFYAFFFVLRFGVCHISTNLPTCPMSDKIGEPTYIMPTKICQKFQICDINTILENVTQNETTYTCSAGL